VTGLRMSGSWNLINMQYEQASRAWNVRPDWLLSSVVFVMFGLGATFVWRGDWNFGPVSISNSCGHDTGGHRREFASIRSDDHSIAGSHKSYRSFPDTVFIRKFHPPFKMNPPPWSAETLRHLLRIHPPPPHPPHQGCA
jgi:hypothetical protein